MVSEPELQLGLGGQSQTCKGPDWGQSVWQGGKQRSSLGAVAWCILPIRKAAHWQNGTLAPAPEEQQILLGSPAEAALRLLCCSGLSHWALMAVINPCGHSWQDEPDPKVWQLLPGYLGLPPGAKCSQGRCPVVSVLGWWSPV